MVGWWLGGLVVERWSSKGGYSGYHPPGVSLHNPPIPLKFTPSPGITEKGMDKNRTLRGDEDRGSGASSSPPPGLLRPALVWSAVDRFEPAPKSNCLRLNRR